MDQVDVVKELLKSGARIDARRTEGKTALDYANDFDAKDTVKVLEKALKGGGGDGGGPS